MIRVDLASGFHPLDGYLHFDMNPHAPDLDVLGDVMHLPFRDGSVDEIQAIDIAEHCSYRDTERMFTEWARVLKPGGRMFVQTPDAEAIMHQYVTQQPVVTEFAHLPPIVSTAWKLLGGHADNERVEDGGDFRLNAHFALFSMDSLRWYTERADMIVEQLGRNPFPNLQMWATRR